MNEQQQKAAAALGALAGGYLFVTGTSPAEAADKARQEIKEATDEATGTVETWEAAYEGAEWGQSDNGVIYDDPETGAANDEPEDDANTSFETIEEETGGAVDAEETAESYAPDVEQGSTAPTSGVVSDPGDSQTWGSAPEQENDDLTEQSADSEMSDDMKSAFDRFANYDDPDNL